MRRSHAGEPLGLGFDHRAEVVAATGVFLLHVDADCGQVVIADRFGKKGALLLGAERVLDGVRSEQGVIAQARVGSEPDPVPCPA